MSTLKEVAEVSPGVWKHTILTPIWTDGVILLSKQNNLNQSCTSKCCVKKQPAKFKTKPAEVFPWKKHTKFGDSRKQ